MFVAVLASLTTTPGQSAELKKPQMPRVIIMNDADTAYRTYCTPEGCPTADRETEPNGFDVRLESHVL